MITLFRSDRVYAPDALPKAVAAQVAQLPRMISAIGEVDTVLRFEFACDPIRPLGWLHNQTAPQKIYWSDRDQTEETAGVGVARTVSGEGLPDYQRVFEELDACLGDDNENIRFYGGFCFAEPSRVSAWEDFGAYRFVVPRFELVRRHDRYTFAVNVTVAEVSDELAALVGQQLSQLEFTGETRYRNVPRRLSRVDFPHWESWKRTLAALQLDAAAKVVLARRSDFAFHVPIRPSALINFLQKHSPGCYHFCFQTEEHRGFLGAPPERLFRLEDDRLLTEALAGTMPAGNNEEEQKLYRRELLASDKCRREQQFVVDHLRRQLESICAVCEIPEQPRVMGLKNVQHLHSPMSGTLAAGVQRADVLAALHPTPAVCGIPVDEARMRIKSLEVFDRGWYAGPVGYVGRRTCEFAVAIRSGLVAQHILSLYSGAGLVEGSVAYEEWNEMETKISRFMKVFQ